MTKSIRTIVLLTAAAVTATAYGQVPLETSPSWQTVFRDWYHTGMMWADINGDGHLDLYLSSGNDIVIAPNTLYLSQRGDVPSLESWRSAKAAYSGRCAAGDIDDDGYPDIVVSNYLGNGGFTTLNYCDVFMSPGGFPDPQPSDHLYPMCNSFDCSFGDVDNDGDLDLALATGEAYYDDPDRDRVYLNNSGVLQNTPDWQTADVTAAYSAEWGDCDNDGDLDLLFAYDTDRGVAIYTNDGGVPGTTPGWQSADTSPSIMAIFGHVNGDGWLDVIVAHNYQTGGHGRFTAYLNDGSGGYPSTPDWQSGTGGYGSALALYDYDNDGDDDLTTGGWWQHPRIYENLGGIFTTAPVWQGDFTIVAEEMTWVDVDGDGAEHYVDTILPWDTRSLFYTSRHPVQQLDSVIADGVKLGNADYCYDRVAGWVSLDRSPTSELLLCYEYSTTADMAVSNWDTSAFVYSNLDPPVVQFSASQSWGRVPFEIDFTDESAGATDQVWRFHDGSTAAGPAATFTYTQAGLHDVYLENTQPDGRHNRLRRDMIIALADTLAFPDQAVFQGDTVIIPIRLRNSQPLRDLVLPVKWSGTGTLSFVGLNTDSCRTDYFDQVSVVLNSPAQSLVVIRLIADQSFSNLPMMPGDGDVVNLLFKATSSSGSFVFDTTSYGDYATFLNAGYIEYTPAVKTGEVGVYICGDADGNGSGPNVADLTALVDYLFRGGPPPDPLAVGNVDGVGTINVNDLSRMVDYLFKLGPPLTCE